MTSAQLGVDSQNPYQALTLYERHLAGGLVLLLPVKIVWWSLLAAFGFMFTLVLAANLFSDVVRDAFDPRLRQQR